MKYQLIRSRRKSIAIQIKADGSVIVRAPLKATKAEIERFLAEKSHWISSHLARIESIPELPPFTEAEIHELANRAKEIIPPRVAYYASRIGVRYGRITIRSQKSRWGSCSAKGNLNFNCLLMLAPIEVVDSVIVHELCHLIEMNHSPRFYEQVYKAYPEYDRCHRWLKENGDAIMRRNPA